MDHPQNVCRGFIKAQRKARSRNLKHIFHSVISLIDQTWKNLTSIQTICINRFLWIWNSSKNNRDTKPVQKNGLRKTTLNVEINRWTILLRVVLILNLMIAYNNISKVKSIRGFFKAFKAYLISILLVHLEIILKCYLYNKY